MTPTSGNRLPTVLPMKIDEGSYKSIMPLDEITISACQIKDPNFLNPIIEGSPHLKKVDLSYNNFIKNSLDQTLLSLAKSPGLKYLNLTHASISTVGVHILSEMFKFSITLLEVNLSHTQFKHPNENVAQIFKGIHLSQTLQSIHMEGLKLGHKELNLLETNKLGIEQPIVHDIDFNDAECERFSVSINDKLIYTRQLIGKKFAFSTSWKREKVCWICDK